MREKTIAFHRALLIAVFACGCSLIYAGNGKVIESGQRDFAAVSPAPRPNILIIYTDDQRWDSLGIAGHPFLKTPHIDRIGREGARFSNAFVTTPVCSPSRASFLTGQYKHTHGVLGNEDSTALSHRLNTFPKLLHEAGYRTGYFGKWHMGGSGEPRPGFDRWVSFDGQGKYLNPALNLDGKRVQAEGYVADILTDHATRFIEERSSRPFCAIVAHKGPHSPFTPAPRHAGLFSKETIERRPNSRDDLAGKPALSKPLPGWPRVGPGTGPGDDQVREQLRTLVAIDEGVGRLLELLERRGELDRTFILFTSDHGHFWGEHGLGDKRAAYEEALRVPLLVRYPPLAAAGTKSEAIVLNIDVAPTLLRLAGLPAPPTMQGKSFLPVRGPARTADATFRTEFLAEYSVEADQPRIPTWRAVRTQRWKYIQYPTLLGGDELYDLAADPLELNNLAGDPEKRDDLRTAENKLAALLAESNHPGRSARFEGLLIDRWQAQNVRDFEDARARQRDAMLTDGNFNSGFVILLPDGSREPIDSADRDRVLAFIEQEKRTSDLRVVATFHDQGEGRRLVSLSPSPMSPRVSSLAGSETKLALQDQREPEGTPKTNREPAIYFPPPDAAGGWRTLKDADEIRRVAGMDKRKLDEAFEFIKGSTKNGGLLVLRKGWLVYENYFGLGHREATPNLASCGKSFTSIAVGMLMAEQPKLFPDGLDQKVFTPAYFPAEAFPLSDPRKKDIKLGQLLAFTAGIRGNNPSYVNGKATTIDPVGPDGWQAKVEAIAHGKQDGVFDNKTPFSAATLWRNPGEGYSYASSSIHLASIMLRHVTGMELQAYVEQRLAKPLGWGRWGYGYKNVPDVTHTPGGGGIALRATDMLRFGYLLLREGRWNDEQLVPAEYVRLCARQSPYNPHYPYSLQFNVNTNGDIPGLPRDAFWKGGSGGHALYVVPSLDLVVWKLAGRDEQYSPDNTGLPASPASQEQVAARRGWKETVDKETALRKTLQMVIESIVDRR